MKFNKERLRSCCVEYIKQENMDSYDRQKLIEEKYYIIGISNFWFFYLKESSNSVCEIIILHYPIYYTNVI